MERFLQDIRFATLSLARSRGFSAVVLLTLALGIGANTAIFSFVNGVILRPLAYPHPDQLMFLNTQFPALGFLHFAVSPPEYMEFREVNRSFSAVGAYTTGEVNLTAGDRPLRVRSASVDEHLLKVLGLQPAEGRLFATGETELTGPPPSPGTPAPLPPSVAILSHELWQAAFGGRPIVGQTVEVDGRSREVVGVMPPGTDVMDNRTEVWLPLGLNPANRQNRAAHTLYLIGRLKDGVTPQTAQTELNALIQNWGERVGLNARSHVFRPLGVDEAHLLQMKPLQDEILGSASRAIWVLQAAVAFVLLIGCANVANLLLARAETRRRELAMRTALGATRARLVRQFMMEGVQLSVAGGAAGVLLAVVGVQALIRAYPTTLPRTTGVSVDLRVLLVALGGSIAVGLLFGLAPIMHTRANGLATTLKESGSKSTAGTSRHHVRRGLVIAQIGLAVLLVAGAGLLIRTVYNLTRVDAGFDRARLVTFSITLPPVNYPRPPGRAQMYQRLLASLRAMPGVQAATAMSGLPPDRPFNALDTDIDNYTPPPQGPPELVDYYQNVMGDYFETMGIPIVQGRSFQSSDVGSGLVAVVNERLASTFWKGLNPIGQRLRPGGNEVPWFTVIGVAKDVKQGGVDQQAATEVYFLVEQRANLPMPIAVAPTTMNVVLRTTVTSAALSQTIERVVRESDRNVPIVRLRDMNTVFDESISRPRFLAQLLGGFAGLALVIAAIGTYAMLSYLVVERRREIGIRMALGADRSRVLVHVLNQGLRLIALGIVVGLAGAFGANRLIASLLYDVRPTDAATLVAVTATIGVVGIVACWLPAWRAARLDPYVVLKDD